MRSVLASVGGEVQQPKILKDTKQLPLQFLPRGSTPCVRTCAVACVALPPGISGAVVASWDLGFHWGQVVTSQWPWLAGASVALNTLLCQTLGCLGSSLGRC